MVDTSSTAPPRVELAAAATLLVDTAEAELRMAAQADGGFPERAGGRFSPGATAWAALAFARNAGAKVVALRAAERLARAQQSDGRVAVAERHSDAV